MESPARPKDDLFDNSTMTFGEHLEELRHSLVRAIIWLMIGLGFGLLVANRVVRYIQTPLREAIIKYNADRDLAELGLTDPDNPMVKRDAEAIEKFHAFLMSNALVAELVYDLPTELTSEAVSKLVAKRAPTPDQIPSPESAKTDSSPLNAPATITSDAEDSVEAELQRIRPADLIRAIGTVPDPAALVPRVQLRRSERGLSSLKVEETFMIWVKAGLIVGAVFASPMIFYHLWSFVAAGLHSHERRYVYVYLPFSVVLFVSGVVLAFFLVLHYVLNFLLAFNSGMNVAVEPRLTYYINFVLLLPLGFGVAFQLPLVMLFLQRIDLIQTKDYISSWRIAVLVIFVISMLVTPADVTSMVALALPLMLLYFLGIGMCAYMPRGRGLGSGAYDPA